MKRRGLTESSVMQHRNIVNNAEMTSHARPRKARNGMTVGVDRQRHSQRACNTLARA